MADVMLAEGESLLVAARGTREEHGLWRFTRGEGAWRGVLLARVAQLSSLCAHPTLPIVYGTGSAAGTLHGWRMEDGIATPIGEVTSGDDPCHLAVDPTGKLLVATNYGSSDLAIVALAGDGSFQGPAAHLELQGGGSDPERQDAAHPHQAIFDGAVLNIVDLGAERIRRFVIDPARPGAEALIALGEVHLPEGTGPRHAVFLDGGRIAVSGELASSLVTGSLAGDWSAVPSTLMTGPAKTRTPRNYPGDIQRADDSAIVYVANRGHDTIAAFDAGATPPRLIAERDAGAAWPQHLLVLGDHLLVAGWDSNRVTALRLSGEGLGAAEPLFECPSPGWLLHWPG